MAEGPTNCTRSALCPENHVGNSTALDFEASRVPKVRYSRRQPCRTAPLSSGRSPRSAYFGSSARAGAARRSRQQAASRTNRGMRTSISRNHEDGLFTTVTNVVRTSRRLLLTKVRYERFSRNRLTPREQVHYLHPP